MHPATQAEANGINLPPVVLDTNVFVAAGFNRDSHAARIVAAVRRRQLRMVWNDATRRETQYILGRIPPLASYNVDSLFHEANRYAGPTHPQHFMRIPDPDDRKFIALAAAADAVLITRDEHLLQHREKGDVLILTSTEFWQRYLGGST